ncbi:28S rRNA (cytosine-C(5))-methyltransferase-like [Penaeus japonicus]|uniref:28S rRNA (cytosine-C(5))-methyltransferase-like n=1 Tax=Penaeus japonicus TaxID=27405 RepID=UPI001C711B48|nr:28S rRNA (cytosine-C(5))-methyltransferase-like [Penaeus japonicus]
MEKRPHSIPVPRIYKEAAKLLKRYENKEGTIKNLVLNNKKYQNYRTLYGLMCKTVQNAPRIQTAIAASRLLVEQPRFDPHLAQILTSELLNKGRLPGKSKPEVTLLEYEEKIRKIIGNSIDTNSEEKEKGSLPRYVRINTLITSIDRVHDHLDREGWRLEGQDLEFSSYDEYLGHVQVRFLLCIFKGRMKVSALASCLPVFLSDITPGSNIIDACAAPGNKTSHIAAVIGNDGKILAVEKNRVRFATLQKLMKARGVECITYENRDFTKLSLDLYGEAHYIILDPTCSASGIEVTRDEISSQRIKGLASFQVHLLKFALSFPFVKEVVYSTCSLYEEENEEVVEDALKFYGRQFELEDLGKKLEGWKHFGNDRFDFGSRCVRTVPDVDRCHGFFVAKFVRKEKPDEEETSECLENLNPSACSEDEEHEHSLNNVKSKKKKKKKSLINADDETFDEECDGEIEKGNAASCESELQGNLEEVEDNHEQTQKKKKKKKKKKRSRESESESGKSNNLLDSNNEEENSDKKKKKNSQNNNCEELQETGVVEECLENNNLKNKSDKKKKKKRKLENDAVEG